MVRRYNLHTVTVHGFDSSTSHGSFEVQLVYSLLEGVSNSLVLWKDTVLCLVLL